MTSATPLIVYPPSEDGGRRVRIGEQFVGIAYRLTDLAAFAQEAGLQDWDDLEVVRSSLIEWRGGGPECWEPPRQ
ncbi:hypothetical protein AB0896_27330 [Streptomyces parvulus]|uniref:hypothetical protein n=1 Tax=Streptomyces parvulus TaxID=146923 RepID=UPI0034532E83